MAKKHLLYIHDERFDEEPHKSALINSLLEKHYDGVVAEQPDHTPETKKKVKANHIVASNKKVVKQVAKVADVKFCEHGYGYGFCKKPACNAKHR